VDGADEKMIQPAKKELQDLLSKKTLEQIPLLVLLNKCDLKESKSAETLAQELWVRLFSLRVRWNLILSYRELKSIEDRDVAYYATSCKTMVNIDQTLEWLIKKSKK